MFKVKTQLLILVWAFLLASCGNDVSGDKNHSSSEELPGSISSENVITQTEDPPEPEVIDSTEILAMLAAEEEKKEAEAAAALEAEKEKAKEEARQKRREERRKKRREARKKKREEEAKQKAAEAARLTVQEDEINLEDIEPELRVKTGGNGQPAVSFFETSYDYGKLMQGEKVDYSFKFKNVGNSELVISDVKVTCGCTQPTYPFIPIGPGEIGAIGVRFDSEGRLGKQRPKITVYTNAEPAKYELFLEGYVDAPRAKGLIEQDTL